MATMNQQRQRTYGYIQPTQNSRMRQQPTTQQQQQGGRNMQTTPRMAAYPSQQMQNQMQMQQFNPNNRCGGGGCCPPSPNPAAANPYCYNTGGTQPINVNISAAQLEGASYTPMNCDRSLEGATPGAKYIPMKWEDILGKTGMNGMRVSMVPSGDPGNQNRQLKVSFGGQTGKMQAGETCLKVVELFVFVEIFRNKTKT